MLFIGNRRMLDRAMARKKATQAPVPVQPSSSTRPRENSFKMALVVNKKLEMEAGTIATQLGHATQGCHRVIRAMATGAASLASWDQKGSWRTIVKGKNAAHLVALETAARKRGSLCTCLVQVDDHSQLKSGSTTVLAIFGEVSEVEALTKDLKLLCPI